MLDTNIFTCLSKVMEQAEPIPDNQISPILPQKVQKKSFISFKKTFSILAFIGAIPVFLFFLVLFSLSIKYEENGYISRQAHKPQFQALPSLGNMSSVDVESSDARIMALEAFFEKYQSPLMGHAQMIVDEADKNKIDYRLLPAIAMQESTLCKKVIKDSNNCWGFGIYGGKVTKFESYNQAIKVISSTLAKKYIQKGYVSPEEIVQKYTPSDTGKWSSVVGLMMEKLTNAL